MRIVQVFTTNVQDEGIARQIIHMLGKVFSHCKINFDLDDCDKILRIENQQALLDETEIQLLLAGYGHYCQPLRE